jgi:excisionase family DNA binding protein
MRTVAEDYVTVAEAAALLRVAPSTIRRWIREGDVPAYRIGRRRVALKRTDLTELITPARAGADKEGEMASIERPVIRRLTPEERQRGLNAVARLKELQQELLAARGGNPFSPSWELLNEARDERSRQLG